MPYSNDGKWFYNIISESPKTCAVKRYYGEDGYTSLPNVNYAQDIVVPSVIDGYTVTRLADTDSQNQVIIPSYMKANSTLTLPNTLVEIGQYALYNCTRFTGTLRIPASVTNIKYMAFYQNAGFTKIEFEASNSTLYLRERAFYVCYGIREIEFLGETWSRSLSMGQYALGLGASGHRANAVVYSYDNWAKNLFNNYINSYTTLTYQETPEPPPVVQKLKFGSELEVYGIKYDQSTDSLVNGKIIDSAAPVNFGESSVIELSKTVVVTDDLIIAPPGYEEQIDPWGNPWAIITNTGYAKFQNLEIGNHDIKSKILAADSEGKVVPASSGDLFEGAGFSATPVIITEED